LRARGIIPRIARKGIESSKRLGRHGWVVERTFSWLTGFRRLSPRYEGHGHNYLAMVTLAAALTCYGQLIKGANNPIPDTLEGSGARRTAGTHARERPPPIA
jgi:hypothetical protein